MAEKTINIKGETYIIKFSNELYDVHEFEPEISEGEFFADGYCDCVSKTIYLYAGENNVVDTTAIHEIIHAYLFESGFNKFAENEFLVDWFAGNIKNILNDTDEILQKIKEI